MYTRRAQRVQSVHVANDV